MATVKKLPMLLTSAVLSAFSSGLEPAHAHGLHLHSDSGHSLSTIDPRLGSDSIFYGEPQPLGNGSMRTWVKLDNNANPSDIGVSFTEAALSRLPTESDNFGEYPLKLTLLDGIGNSTFEYELLFPKEAAATPFTHMSLNYNPLGHAPAGVTNVPHFDVHFNMLTPEERHAITADNSEEFLQKAYKRPPAELIPDGFALAPNSAEPRMGSHYGDFTSDDFQTPWEKAFIYGFYDGRMVFWEPMIANSFLETKPNTTTPIKQPTFYPKNGYYPTAYSVNYADGEYSVSLNGLTFRSSKSVSVPEPNLTLGTLAFGAFATGFLLKRRKKQTVMGSASN